MSKNFKRLFSILGLALTTAASAQDSLWICAAGAKDIPAGYYVAQLSYPTDRCSWNQHYAAIIKIKDQPGFWQWDFFQIGAPAGFVVTTASSVQFSGCRRPGKDQNGKAVCLESKGWPITYVKRLQ